MKKTKPILLIAIGLVALIILLNPSDEKIKAEVVKELKAIILPREPGKEAAINSMIENAASQGLTIENHLFYKEVFFSYGTEKRKAGWAALGNVKLNIKGN